MRGYFQQSTQTASHTDRDCVIMNDRGRTVSR
jgi:hypothetical protein